MKHLSLQHMIVTGIFALALGACVHEPAQSLKADMPIEASSPPPQHMVLLQEAHSETANLRGEVASLKILMAKQMGELRSLREQSQSVHHREQDQGLQLQNIRSQLLASQAELDQLRKQNMTLESQVTNMPDTSQLISDIQAMRTSFQQMMGGMKELVSDMRLIKQEMSILPKNLTPQQTKMTTSLPSVAKADTPLPDAQGHIIIQDGDTLWQLSQTYQVSVSQIQAWNNLSSDLIIAGLRLMILAPVKTGEPRPNHVGALTPSPAQKVMKNKLRIPVPKAPQPKMNNHVAAPPEPTHILSIASSQSDSHESP